MTEPERSTEVVARQAWLALGVGIAAMTMLPISGTGTNLSFPDIESAFPGSTRSTLSWALSGYAIVIAAFTLLGGQLTDRLDGERVFRFGLAIFGVGSLMVGTAPNAGLVIAGRCMQGVGGALIVPSSLLVVTSRWPPHRHTFAIGVWTVAFPIGASISPGLVSVILQLASWRWVFVTMAIVAGAVVVAHVLLLGPAASGGALDASEGPGSGHPDYLGVLVGSAGVGLAALGIVQGPSWGWSSPGVVGALVAAALSGPLFVRRSRRHPRPMVDLAMFSVPTYGVASAANLFISAVGAATWLLLPLLLTGEWGYSRIAVGFAITPAPVVVAICSIVSARIAERAGYRGTLLLGCALLVLCNLWFVLALGAEADYIRTLLPGLILHGAGMGFTFAPLNAAALSEMPTSSYGQANASFATIRFLANAIGIAAAIAALDSAAASMVGFDRAFGLLGGLSVVAVLVVTVAWPRRRTTIASDGA